MEAQKRCDNCTFSTFAVGRGRPTLICRQERGHEGRWKTHSLLEKCDNFHPSRVASAEDSAPRLIPLTRGKFATVDAQDYNELIKFVWHMAKRRKSCYAVRCHKGKPIKMHRVITNAPPELLVDHIDHDGLNNRRSNLRLATHAQNCQNRIRAVKAASGYRGVYWDKEAKKYEVKIRARNKTHNLGYFKDEIEAAKAYDQAARRLHGEFAVLNTPGTSLED